MVALFACTLGGFTVTEHKVCKHTLADMNTTVVDEVDFLYFSALALQELGDTLTKRIITHMAQVQGFICVGARKLHHHLLSLKRVPHAVFIALLSDGVEYG